MNNILKTKEGKMILGFLGIILIIIIIASILRSCNTPKSLSQKDLKLREFEQKIKLYEDSLLIINKSLQKTQIIKDTVYLKHTEYKTGKYTKYNTSKFTQYNCANSRY